MMCANSGFFLPLQAIKGCSAVLSHVSLNYVGDDKPVYAIGTVPVKIFDGKTWRSAENVRLAPGFGVTSLFSIGAAGKSGFKTEFTRDWHRRSDQQPLNFGIGVKFNPSLVR